MNLVTIYLLYLWCMTKEKNIKTTGSLRGKSCRIKHTKKNFLKNHALLVDKPSFDQSKYTAEHEYKIYWSNVQAHTNI